MDRNSTDEMTSTQRRLFLRYGVWAAAAALLTAGACLLWWPLPDPPFPADYSTVVLDRDGGMLHVSLNNKEQWHLPPDSAAVPAKLEAAVLLFEDRRFRRHPGIDPLALARALWANARAGRVRSGASTLTMQVARLMRPRPRTLPNKVREALTALGLERRYGKDRILRLYLDHAPYGGNTVGYRTASWRYFGKDPGRLTWAEAATLAVLPNAPGLVSPTADPQRLKAKRDRLLERLGAAGHMDAATCRLAQKEAVAARVRPLPRRAPHLARRFDGETRVRSGIDRRLQERAAAQVRRYAARLRRLGVRNAAALIAETQSGRVRAYIGSQDFFDRPGQGQVDGVTAPRSSGSLLKPFLYGLAMDDGLLLPQTALEDIPTQYGGFTPRNADQQFAGLVEARLALVRSLNVPAVRLLRRYGLYPFYGFLRGAGVSTLFRDPDDYGLPLILGGAEVTLWDMAGLFAGLGRGGLFAPLRLRADGTRARGRRLLSPGAAHLTLEALRQVERPGAEYYWRQYQDAWPLAWKTGTSYGHRDAWAVGVSPQWVVAVWAGNFSGEGNANLGGAVTAGPLLFDLFNALPKEEGRRWFEAPAGIRSPALCAASGYAAGPHCPQRESAPAPAAARPLPLCPYHRTLYLDADGGEQVCSLCWENQRPRPRGWLVLPPEVAAHASLAAPPPHRSSCPAQAETAPLRLVYPRPGARLRLGRDFDGGRQPVVLRAAHRDPRRVLHWYLDERYLGQTRARHMMTAHLEAGRHSVEVVDQQGNRTRVGFWAVGED